MGRMSFLPPSSVSALKVAQKTNSKQWSGLASCFSYTTAILTRAIALYAGSVLYKSTHSLCDASKKDVILKQIA